MSRYHPFLNTLKLRFWARVSSCAIHCHVAAVIKEKKRKQVIHLIIRLQPRFIGCKYSEKNKKRKQERKGKGKKENKRLIRRQLY